MSALARLFDPDTAIDAGESVREHLPAMQIEVLAVLGRWLNGATAYEVMCDLNRQGRGRQQNSIAKRCSDLAANGYLIDTGDRRVGSSNRLLIVWKVTDQGRRAAAA